MRDIKFRAWNEKNDFMDEDFYIHSSGSQYDLAERNYNTPHIEIEKTELKLMQYTGLKDKNDVEIYEGDIVRHSKVSDDISIIRFGEFGVPNFEEQGYQDLAVGFYFENASKLKNIEPFNMTIPLNKDYVKKIKVIGNIYENPELLEGN